MDSILTDALSNQSIKMYYIRTKNQGKHFQRNYNFNEANLLSMLRMIVISHHVIEGFSLHCHQVTPHMTTRLCVRSFLVR